MKRKRVTPALLVIPSIVLVFGVIQNHSAAEAAREKEGKGASESGKEILPVVAARKAPSAPDPVVESRSRKTPRLRFVGDGTSGKVVGPDGKILMESGGEIGIFGASEAADQVHVLVKAGDGINFVIDSSTGDRIQLPLKPPGADMMCFDWYWINGQKLLGVSGIEADDSKVKASGYCKEPHASLSKLYVYDVPTKQLREVAFPDKEVGPVFFVTEVSHDGLFHIFGEGDRNPDLGWFQVD